MAKAVVVEEVVDVTDPGPERADHSLLDTRKEIDSVSDWVDPATVTDSVKTSYVEAMEALAASE